MRKPFKPKLTIAVAHLATTLFSAELYDPQLGKGVNFSETQTLGTCIEYDKKNLLMNEKTLKREFTENRVRSREEMGKTLNVDVAVSAKGLWGSASGSVAVFNQSRFNEENFYWIVDANYQIGSQSIDTASHKFKLTEEAQKILKAHGWSGFVKACGTHFYGGVVLGAR